MRGDWKDQRLNQDYQHKMMQQAEKARLAQCVNRSEKRGTSLFYQVFRVWVNNLFNVHQPDRRRTITLNKTQKLRAVK